ncbi:hypothetical protein [Azospirillum sp.]|uniref:hypothetical protein n=1 Tax=Azospirillum sp. TaxID=34012 RepID=UPI003D73E45E
MRRDFSYFSGPVAEIVHHGHGKPLPEGYEYLPQRASHHTQHSAMIGPKARRLHTYVTSGDDGAPVLVVWRDGSRRCIEIPLADPLGLAQELVARYREHRQGQPRPDKLGDP